MISKYFRKLFFLSQSEPGYLIYSRCGVLSWHPITLRQNTLIKTPLDKW